MPKYHRKHDSRELRLDEGAVSAVAHSIKRMHERIGGTVVVGIDGDKHTFKSTFASAVDRVLGKELHVGVVHLDTYLKESLIMDGEVIQKEDWDWTTLARDIETDRKSAKLDVMLVEGFGLFNVCRSTRMRPADFHMRIRLTANRATRAWGFMHEGSDREQAMKCAREITQKYPPGVAPRYDYVVDMSADFWREAEPVIVEFFGARFGRKPLEMHLALLPDGSTRQAADAVLEPEKIRRLKEEGGIEALVVPVKRIVDYKPERPLISECVLDVSDETVLGSLHQLFDVPRQFARDGIYCVLAYNMQTFALARFDEHSRKADAIFLDPKDIAPGRPMDYWIKRRGEAIWINPIRGARELEGIEPVTDPSGRHLTGVRLLIKKTA